MTDPTPLSPAAQAVRDAVLATYADNIPKDENLWALDRASVVAALRAAADQVAPSDLDEPRNYLPMAIECQRIREELLAIAAELDGTNPSGKN